MLPKKPTLRVNPSLYMVTWTNGPDTYKKTFTDIRLMGEFIAKGASTFDLKFTVHVHNYTGVL